MACPAPEKTARDVIATAQGVTDKKQADFRDRCVATPTAPPCVLINRVGNARNVAIDALIVYCSNNPQAFNQGAPCSPVKSALPALQTAISGLKQITADLEGVK